MSKVAETVLEIDLSALAHNYNYLRSRLKSTTKFMAVVKAYAYGADAYAIAQKLEALKVDFLAVAYVYEGVALREAGIKTPILVLHPQIVHFKALLKHCLTPSIYSKKILQEFIVICTQNNTKEYPIHLKFNTGLNRLGFSETEIDDVIQKIQLTKNIKVEGILSHLAATEDLEEKDFTLNQLNAFKQICEKVAAMLNYVPIRHVLNTSGIINYPEAQYDMVRSGIGLYGYGNDTKIDPYLKPVATLKTIIAQLHTISVGDTVGYNRKFKSTKKITTATLPLGHADGIGREYGHGKTYVSIHGQKAPIIGNVCMDMIMVDVTNIDCKEGDEVLLFGKNLSAASFAQTANTISYEVLTGISQRVKRIVIN